MIIVTVDSLNGKTVEEYADDYYDDNGYGYGENNSGILFLVAMDDRELEYIYKVEMRSRRLQMRGLRIWKTSLYQI